MQGGAAPAPPHVASRSWNSRSSLTEEYGLHMNCTRAAQMRSDWPTKWCHLGAGDFQCADYLEWCKKRAGLLQFGFQTWHQKSLQSECGPSLHLQKYDIAAGTTQVQRTRKAAYSCMLSLYNSFKKHQTRMQQCTTPHIPQTTGTRRGGVWGQWGLGRDWQNTYSLVSPNTKLNAWSDLSLKHDHWHRSLRWPCCAARVLLELPPMQSQVVTMYNSRSPGATKIPIYAGLQGNSFRCECTSICEKMILEKKWCPRWWW